MTSLKERLLVNLRPVESGCWEWIGARNRRGYGHIARGGGGKTRLLLTHRAAYEVFVGQIPSGMCVLHRCDNPPCCNPLHLFLGTRTDNHADMVSKGRQPSGEANGQARLTDEQVNEMFALYFREWGVNRIADEFDCSHAQASRILSGQRRGTGMKQIAG